MDSLIIWKSLIIFSFSFFFSWVFFYTFQPDILSGENLINPRTGLRDYSGSDALLSDVGRHTLLGYSLIAPIIITFLYLTYSLYIVRPVTIKCSPKAKKMGQCKIIRK